MSSGVWTLLARAFASGLGGEVCGRISERITMQSRRKHTGWKDVVQRQMWIVEP